MATLTIQPSAAAGIDTYINQSNPTFNYGVSTTLLMNGGGSGAGKYTYIKFDLSSIPANVAIVSAIVTLTNTSTSGGGPSISAYRVPTVWYEGAANGAAPGAGVDGSTWNLRNANGSLAWTAGAGGDHTPLIGSMDSGSFVASGANNIDLTSEVQGIYAGTITNNGWAFTTSGSGDYGFASSDHATSTSRPKLVITYRSKISATLAATSTITSVISSSFNTNSATELAIQPDATAGKDTVIRQSNTTLNYGTTVEVSMGYDAGSNLNKFLIQMPLTAIPSNAIIYGAFLGLYVTNQGNSTATDFTLRRAITDWYEGSKNGVAPSAGENASTWALRNTNGSVAWGSAGGASTTDYEPVGNASDTMTVYGTGSFVYFEVTQDIIDFLSGAKTNRGWWVLPSAVAANNYKNVATSDNTTAANRPKLLVYYATPQTVIASSSTLTGTLTGVAGAEAALAGSSTVTAQLITNFFSIASISASSSVSGSLRAMGNIRAVIFGESSVVGDIKADYQSFATLSGTSTVVGDIKGVFRMNTLISGSGSMTGIGSSRGQIRVSIQGTSDLTVVGYARAVSVAAVIGCNPVPLLHITNGGIKSNGQLNILNFLSDRAGYFLVNYKPQIPQYKDGGYWSSSPQSQGRRLKGKVFDNVIDVLEVAARASSQDSLIQFQQDLMDFQEAASDYWTSEHAFLPYYLVARAARESYTRYALIHMISCPELENPYTQPFFDDSIGAVFSSLTIRIERGLWQAKPPGQSDCVAVSGQREWTVSGWQAGS